MTIDTLIQALRYALEDYADKNSDFIVKGGDSCQYDGFIHYERLAELIMYRLPNSDPTL